MGTATSTALVHDGDSTCGGTQWPHAVMSHMTNLMPTTQAVMLSSPMQQSHSVPTSELYYAVFTILTIQLCHYNESHLGSTIATVLFCPNHHNCLMRY